MNLFKLHLLQKTKYDSLSESFSVLNYFGLKTLNNTWTLWTIDANFAVWKNNAFKIIILLVLAGYYFWISFRNFSFPAMVFPNIWTYIFLHIIRIEELISPLVLFIFFLHSWSIVPVFYAKFLNTHKKKILVV